MTVSGRLRIISEQWWASLSYDPPWESGDADGQQKQQENQ